MTVPCRYLLPILLLISGCSSAVERVQSVGAGKGDYRRSPCACMRLDITAPTGADALRRSLMLEQALS